VGVPYDSHEIERRWRHRWEEAGLYQLDLDAADPAKVFYNLVEFPYPSAQGLHVGHVFKYSGADAYGRYQRMLGRQVFQPIGFDAFGIHTENYALKADRHPMRLTGQTTEAFRAQLSRGGMAWDWSRSVDTSRPDYYRWTQWILTRLFRAGLMYQAEAPVLWCPSCLTVLAREQTESTSGVKVCERCSTPVTERQMRQWFLRITAFADRLVDGLSGLDWPERAKRLQRQWIGRSVGREIDFGDVTVFTTRPDTLPAVTFLVVAPGHPAAGSSRPHPLTGAAVPVLAADYVIESYGTGAVMGVPAHDERDRRFAAANGLSVSDAVLLGPDEAARLGRPAVRYRLRDWLISRQRYWGPPIPIIHCEGCGPVAVPDEDLPVVLPDVDEFRPAGTGVSPLAAVADFVHVSCPACGGPARRETDVSDTFVDSAWYFLRYPSTDFDDRPWDADRTSRILPVDLYAGGPEHVQRHHLYARFVTMALHDLGLVPFEEPFPRIRLGGLIVKEGAKMSKSRGNVINPDDYVTAHGSDVLRCALLFISPWEVGGDFHDGTISGIERFFSRVWNTVTGPTREQEGSDAAAERAIAAVTAAIEQLRFNVALARLMELAPQATTERGKRVLVQLLAPLAPHLAEELWAQLGEPFSVHASPWPTAEHVASSGAPVEIVVQVDGRVRARIHVAPDSAEADVVAAAVAAVGDVTPVRVVYVPGRVINLVTQNLGSGVETGRRRSWTGMTGSVPCRPDARGAPMKQYLLSVHDAPGETPSAEDIEQAYKAVDAFNGELQAHGAWVFAGGLFPADTATVVRVKDGEVLTTDGPFAETKEQLGGFWVIKAPDLDAALAWAAKGAAACRAAVEVRPFQDEPEA
jgi:leucyl-tRNA synthetase